MTQNYRFETILGMVVLQSFYLLETHTIATSVFHWDCGLKFPEYFSVSVGLQFVQCYLSQSGQNRAVIIGPLYTTEKNIFCALEILQLIPCQNPETSHC